MAVSKWKFTARASLLSAALVLFVTGCTDYKQIKADLLQAVNKQEEIKNYRFTGSIELKADAALLGQANPFAAALFAILKDSKIEYTGISALEPTSQLETNLKVTPAGGSVIDIPVLIKDSKLFFHMPALNKDDEYMMLPIQAKQNPASSSSNPEPLKNTGHLSAALNQQLLNGVDANWLQSTKEPVTLSDGTAAKRITLDINSKNEKAFADYWDQSLPGLLELLKTNGLASGASLDSWQSALKQMKFKAPTTIDMLIDNDGYIHEQKWSLSFTANGSTNDNRIIWTQSLTEINKNPAFTKDIPAKQKSLDELLKLTKQAPAVKKAN
ncbi:hypothetical protein [Paenibacillus radicis (ex Xue et al. 2023)]|uniref:Uncharacterized protein n=1 Tax=Paenibacillus radicis (ex Xue et al. 2023) TaxID=2972489 RepID=A0ABT1YP79_9BACL|nr:hypothetical protein [Paenibacillus radicis (ex Xue et al. 2023)]MCR8634988.1 hypothetical protein [Paenibacillus radicis (ex Xue et al. 2023)]